MALYVPGGTASYPSTVLMNAVPAKLAGVKDLVIITPVKEDGKVNPIIIAAAKVSGSIQSINLVALKGWLPLLMVLKQ